jgi:hypothetical protein
MQSGDTVRTNVYTIHFWWDSEGNHRDKFLGNPVATWVGKNAKVLDKKESVEVVKLIHEQFPYLKEIEARHAQLMHARL